MSKKLKAIICALTAGMMLTTSVGFTAFAAEETKADGSGTETVLAADGSEAVATEEPETFNGADVEEDEADTARLADETEEQATEAPTATPVPKSYDDDTYYQNALQVCSALGIITGYDDGSVKPESTVTRAEMATIILRMIAIAGDSTYKNVFTDVNTSHWAANTIQTAVEQGIVDGMGDGTFVPDGPVKYEQVIKMIVCAMNYGVDAENAGGYPAGYLAVGGSTLKLLTGVSGTAGDDMPRGEVIKAVYNALKASYRRIKGFDNGYPQYEAVDSLGVEKFDMYEEEGILTETPNISLSSGSSKPEGMVTIDGVSYKCDFDVDKYIASKVKFYYIDDKNDDNKIIAMFSMDKSAEKTFDSSEIESIDTARGNIKAYTSVTSNSTKKYDLDAATVIYNGTLIVENDFDSFATTEYFKKVYKGTDRADSYDAFLKPLTGTVRIVDFENDGKYDIIFVDAYDTMLVTNATTEKLTGKINGPDNSLTLEYDLDDKNYEISVTKNGTTASVKNLRKNDVASVKRNLDGTKIDITVTGEAVTGTVSGVGEEDNETTATVNGQTYKVDKNAVPDIYSGVTGTFYFDMFDRIGYANLESVLTNNEKYAMIAKVYYDDENDDEVVIRLFTQDGTEVNAKTANNISVWFPGEDSVTTKPSDATIYSKLNSNSYIKCNGNPVKLCKYVLNSSGEISKLYVAVNAADIDTADYNKAVVLYATDLKGVPSMGGTLDGYTIKDGIVGFRVPDDDTDRNTTSNYTASAVTASSYKSYDGGVDRHFVIGGFTPGSTKVANVLVEFTSSATSVYKISDFNTASVLPSMLISRINSAVDDDGDTVFIIKGYTNGSEVSYTTTDTTGIYSFTGFNTTGGVREYGGSTLFDATQDAPNDIYDAIEPGDVVSLAVNGANIRGMIKIADAGDVVSSVVTGTNATKPISTADRNWASGYGISDSREKYYFGFVDSIEVDDNALINLTYIDSSKTGAASYNTSAVFSYVTITIDSDGKIVDTKVDKTGGMEPSELYGLKDDAGIYDYCIFTALKGNMNTGYVIRVEKQD